MSAPASEFRVVSATAPSFPAVAADVALQPAEAMHWQVLCGDSDHWRAGLYAPVQTCAAELTELERHTCPELFLLLRGRLNLVLADGDGGTRELELHQGEPVLVSAPHAGYCPDGPHSGAAFVVERDLFATEYRPAAAWRDAG